MKLPGWEQWEPEKDQRVFSTFNRLTPLGYIERILAYLEDYDYKVVVRQFDGGPNLILTVRNDPDCQWQWLALDDDEPITTK